MDSLINTRRPVREMTVADVEAVLQDDYLNSWLFKSNEGKYMIAAGNAAKSSWHFVGEKHSEDCQYWHRFITLPGIGKGTSFIPITCMNCWKVVIRPRTLKELFILLDGMIKLNHRGKCGIETRETVCGNYGGYLYTESLETGLERYDQAREMVDSILGESVDVILKRGCTEYELAYGDSEKWQPYEGQKEVEEWVIENFDHYSINGHHQSEESLGIIHGEWVKHAYSIGDKTYLEYTGNTPIYAPYKTYHAKGGN